MEGASGRNYADYINTAVLKPLGMNSSVLDSTASSVEWLSRPYGAEKNGVLINGEYLDTSDRIPAGGIYLL